MDTVASRLGADINYRIPRARCASIKNLVAPNQAQSKRIHQRIAGVTSLELNLAAQVRNAKAVAVRSNTRNHALHHRMVFMNLRRGSLSLWGGGAMPRNGAKPRHIVRSRRNR